MTPENDPGLPLLLLLLGESTFDAVDVPRAIEVLRDAQRAAAASGQRTVELRARMKELDVLLQTEQDTTAALNEAKAGIVELQGLGDPEGLAAGWELISTVGNVRGDYALKEEASRHRLECAKGAGLRRHAARATGVLIAALQQGATPVDDAIRQAEQAIADFPIERPGEGPLGMLYAFAGRDAEAVEAIERERRKLLDLGERVFHAATAQNVGLVSLLAGQPDRAEAELRAGAEMLESAGETGWLSTVAAVLAEVLYQLGRYDEAEEWARRSDETASPEDPVSQALWRATQAKVLARRAEAEQAMRLASESVEQARRGDLLPVLGDCLASRGEVLRLLGRADEARSVLAEALAVYERKGIVPSIEQTRTLLAEIPV
jgi:tetratricopeptide (TPR) repeat protein